MNEIFKYTSKLYNHKVYIPTTLMELMKWDKNDELELLITQKVIKHDSLGDIIIKECKLVKKNKLVQIV